VRILSSAILAKTLPRQLHRSLPPNRLAVRTAAAGGRRPSYIAGLILLAAAPCKAMVFVWSNLCDRDPAYTLTQVALNDLIMVFTFAPLVGLLLRVAAITVPWDMLLLSVALYIVAIVKRTRGWYKKGSISYGSESGPERP